ncbi:unnamed protein product [Arctogadus glacialis]
MPYLHWSLNCCHGPPLHTPRKVQGFGGRYNAGPDSKGKGKARAAGQEGHMSYALIKPLHDARGERETGESAHENRASSSSSAACSQFIVTASVNSKEYIALFLSLPSGCVSLLCSFTCLLLICIAR